MTSRCLRWAAAVVPWRRRLLAAVAATGLVVLAGAGQASAATLTVCPGCLYTTIQDAIDHATGGDTIKIAAGTYTENLNTGGKNLSLAGAGTAKTTIDGGGNSTVVVIDSGSVEISGVTITGGNAGNDFGGGILNRGDSTLTLKNSAVTGNTASHGGGIANLNAGTLTLKNTTVSGNTAGIDGGIVTTGTLTLKNSTVSGNTAAGIGGGIGGVGTLTLNNSKVTGNTANSSGGGIDQGGGTLTLNNSEVTGNDAAAFAGGIAIAGTLTLSNSKVTGNTAGIGAGGITNVRPMTLNNSTIRCNSPDDIVGPFTQKNSKIGPPGPC